MMEPYFLEKPDKLNAKAKQVIEIESFIKNNGWIFSSDNSDVMSGIYSYFKKDNIGIDIDKHEIVLVGEEGDFAHIPIAPYCIYTLFGYLLQGKYIAIDYKWI